MKKIAQLIILIGLATPLLVGAATKTAVLQVSFEVKESCSVQSSTADAQRPASAPAVSCQLKAPYQVSRNEPAASTDHSNAAVAQTGTQDWTVTF